MTLESLAAKRRCAFVVRTRIRNNGEYAVSVGAVEKMRWRSVRLHTEHDNIYETAPDPGTFGDVRRDSAYGPGLSNVDFSLGKHFHLWERAAIQIRVDVSSVLNHRSFGLPDSGIGPGHLFGVVSRRFRAAGVFAS